MNTAINQLSPNAYISHESIEDDATEDGNSGSDDTHSTGPSRRASTEQFSPELTAGLSRTSSGQAASSSDSS